MFDGHSTTPLAERETSAPRNTLLRHLMYGKIEFSFTRGKGFHSIWKMRPENSGLKKRSQGFERLFEGLNP
jgi:hypothetical protein